MSGSEPAEAMTTLEIRKGPDAELRVGGLRYVACRREVDDIDGGITLIVRGDDGEASDPDLLRFDLFRARPHYHAPADRQEETAIDVVGAEGIAWGVEAVTARIDALLREAGHPEVVETLDPGKLADAGPRLRALLDGLAEPDEISHFDVPSRTVEALRGSAAGDTA